MFMAAISLKGRRCGGTNRCDPSIIHQRVYVFVCVCMDGPACRLVTQSLSCYFFTIILVITSHNSSLLSESLALMVFLAELDFLCAPAVFMHTTSPPIPPCIPPFF